MSKQEHQPTVSPATAPAGKNPILTINGKPAEVLLPAWRLVEWKKEEAEVEAARLQAEISVAAGKSEVNFDAKKDEVAEAKFSANAPAIFGAKLAGDCILPISSKRYGYFSVRRDLLIAAGLSKGEIRLVGNFAADRAYKHRSDIPAVKKFIGLLRTVSTENGKFYSSRAAESMVWPAKAAISAPVAAAVSAGDLLAGLDGDALRACLPAVVEAYRAAGLASVLSAALVPAASVPVPAKPATIAA